MIFKKYLYYVALLASVCLLVVFRSGVWAGVNDRFSEIELGDSGNTANVIILPEITAAPTGNPVSGKGWIYNLSGTYYFEDDSGSQTPLAAGSTAWDDIGNPDANGSITFSTYTSMQTGASTAANQWTWKDTGAFGDIAIVSIEQDTGNATDGKLLQLKMTDTDVDFLSLYRGSELFKIDSSGVITAGAVAIDYTDFDVSADGVVTLAPDGSPAAIVVLSPSAAATTGFDASDADLTNAISIGANAISGTNFSVNGAGVVNSTGLDLAEGNITNGGTAAFDQINADAGALALGTGAETIAVSSTNWTVSGAGAVQTTSTLDVDGNANLGDTTAGSDVTIGNSTGNIAMTSDNADITLTDTTDNAFQLVNSGGAVLMDVDLGATDQITIGSGAEHVVVDSDNIDISNAGAITGATGVSTSGALASTGTFDVDGNANISDTTAGADVTMGNSTGNVHVAGDSIQLSGTDATDNVFQVQNASGSVVYIDLDLGAADALTLGNAAGTTAITSSDWGIGTTGNMTGIGDVGSNGLYTFTGSAAASDAFKVDVQDSATGQYFVVDAGPWLGTAGEGAALDFTSDSAATAEAGTVIRVKLQGTGADAAAIDGKAIYLEDEAASTAGSYLVNIDSANNGSLHATAGEVLFEDAAPLKFEGATADAFESELDVIDPTADRTITLPDYSGNTPLVIANSQTQTDASGVGAATDVTGSDLSIADGWFTAGKALQWTAYGTSDGSGGAAMSLALNVDGSQFGIVELTTGQSDDWFLDCRLNEHTGTANQKILCTLQAQGESSVVEYDVDTTNFNDGGATTVKLVANTNHANDHIYVESVEIRTWEK